MYILVRDGQVSNPLFGAQQLLLLPTVTVTSPFPFHCLRSLNHRSPGTAKAHSSPHYLHFWLKKKKKKPSFRVENKLLVLSHHLIYGKFSIQDCNLEIKV